MPVISEPNSHELFVWNAEELLREVSRVGLEKGLKFNETLKNHADADTVALTQLMQAGSRIAQQIRLLGVLGRAYVKDVGGTKYIIFKGNQRLRPNLKGTRYLAENVKVKCFVIGSKDIIEDATHGTKIAVVAFVAIDIAMEVTSDHFSFASLGVRVGSDVLQAILSVGAGAAAGVFLATTLAAPVVVTYVVVIAVGFAVGVVLTELDRRYSLTERARARMMAIAAEIKNQAPALKPEVIRQEVSKVGSSIATTAKVIADRTTAEAKAGYYRVDRFFVSVAQMMEADASALLARP